MSSEKKKGGQVQRTTGQQPRVAGKHQPQQQQPQQPGERFVAQGFSGPLPPPVLLQAYEQVLPGSAAQIISWAEREGMHRREMERAVVKSAHRLDAMGMVFAFLLAGGILAGSFWALSNDKQVGGIAGIITAVAGLVAVFYVSHRQST